MLKLLFDINTPLDSSYWLTWRYPVSFCIFHPGAILVSIIVTYFYSRTIFRKTASKLAMVLKERFAVMTCRFLPSSFIPNYITDHVEDFTDDWIQESLSKGRIPKVTLQLVLLVERVSVWFFANNINAILIFVHGLNQNETIICFRFRVC